MLTVACYSIYHSPNAYLGVVTAEQALAGLPVALERRPIAIPKSRGVRVADLVGGGEPARKSEYHREDCSRWARRYDIELNWLTPGVFEQRAMRWRASPTDREELPARAYYAALGTGKEHALDEGLFRAAWVERQDVNEDVVVRQVASSVGLDADRLLASAQGEGPRQMLAASLEAFDNAGCPGVPTWVVNGERFWGKDRVEWLVARVRELLEDRSGPDQVTRPRPSVVLP